jgi:hypothetical protein
MVNPHATYSYFLVGQYVEEKVAKRMIRLYSLLANFIQKNALIMEAVDKDLKIVRAIPYGKIQARLVSKGIREDLEAAKKGMNLYKITFGGVDLQLGMLVSNQGLPVYLKKYGVPESEIRFFQEEAEEYFHENYAPLVQRWGIIKDHLDTLKMLIERQIEELELVEEKKYLKALSTSQAIWELFDQERSEFWELVKVSKFTKAELVHVESEAKTTISQAKTALAAYRKILNRAVERDTKKIDDRAPLESEDLSANKREARAQALEVKKLLIKMIYALGVVSILAAVPRMFLTEGIVKKISHFFGGDLEKEGEALLREAAGLGLGLMGMA